MKKNLEEQFSVMNKNKSILVLDKELLLVTYTCNTFRRSALVIL